MFSLYGYINYSLKHFANLLFQGEVVNPFTIIQNIYIQDARWGSVFYQHYLAECKVHETRSQAHAPSDESRIMTRKQKAGQSKAHEGEQSPKKAKNGKDKNDSTNGKSEDKIAKEYEEFCKAIEEHLSVEQMREILDMDEQDSSSGSDGVVTTKWQVNPSLIGKLLRV